MGIPDNKSATIKTGDLQGQDKNLGEGQNSQVNDKNYQANDKNNQVNGKNGQTINWEKRFKDTQAAYTKARQEIAKLKAKLKVLEETNNTYIKPNIPEEKAKELEKLKFEDPDKWRLEMNKLEEMAKNEANQKISQVEKKLSELEKRQLIFEEFQASHPDVVINDDVIKYDVPPRITQKLESGKITFQEFLEEAYNYLKTPKVVGDGNKTIGQPNLNKVGGDDTPFNGSVYQDIVKSYKNEVY